MTGAKQASLEIPSPLAATPRAAALALSLTVTGALVLTLYRCAAWLTYHPDGARIGADLPPVLWMGWRFDLKMMAVLALLLLLTAWVSPVSLRRRLLLIGSAVLLLLVNLLAIVNHYYFGFYGSSIDPMVFGLFEDDTRIVLHTVVHGYPLLRVLAVWLAATAVQALLVQRLAARVTWALPLQKWSRAVNVIVLLVLVFLARGSLGAYPLGTKHLSVVADPFTNQLVPNALLATYIAVKLRNQASLGDDPNAGLKHYGFRSAREAAALLGLSATPDERALLASLYARTPFNAQARQRPPHVVFALMESFGRHILEYQRADNDVLGRFARHMQEDYVFLNVVSSQHGTHGTLESLLLGSPITPLTQGRFGYKGYAAAAARPYQAAGYRTVFLTSGPASWRNIADVARRQGFDEVIDVSTLREHYPDAEFNIRGAPDEYSFRYAMELIAEGDRTGRPVFVFLLTTNNHPPYEAPGTYVPRPLNLDAYGARAPKDRELGRRILTTYQYAADALGGFLDDLKASPLAERSLVVAVGDHNTRQFFQYTGYDELPLAYGVPLYFYLPPAARAHVTYNPQRFAGMRDIFPTLYRHSLSGSCYFASGDDLLGPEPAGGSAGIALYEHVLAPEGAIANLKKQKFLRWADDRHVRLQPFDSDVPATLKLRARREKARLALLDWHTRMSALKSLPAWPPCAPERVMASR
jgi:phosphoglycerol transferase MdoB-like AlkP superfamily enzyme